MSRHPMVLLALALALSACAAEPEFEDRFLLQISSAPPEAGGPTVDEVVKDGSLLVRWRVKKEDPPEVLNLGSGENLSSTRDPFSAPVTLDLTALVKAREFNTDELLFDVRTVLGGTTITQIQLTPIRLTLPGVASVHLTPPTDDTCTPDCADKDCGADGCGNTCGDGCPADSPNCSELTDFKCTDCLPDCEGKSCGDNGCGGLCGIPDTENGCSSAFPVCSDGGCIAAPAGCESDADCDDGDPCTVGEACSDGACVEGAPRSCDDENPCTDDTCDPEVADGCVHSPAEAACDDGDPCTEGDACAEGACVPGQAKACDDGDPCNGVEACDGDGECQAGEAVDCDDGNECTDDLCDSAQGGACEHTPNQGPCGCTDLVEGDVLSVFTADAEDNPLNEPPLNTELSVIQTEDGAIAGSVALRVVTTAGFAFDIDYNATAPMDVSESDELRLAVRGFNDDVFGWQDDPDKLPIVTLRDQSGAERTLTPNQTQISTDGTWTALVIPLQGGSGWQASEDPVDLTSLMGFRLTLDTWGFVGFTVDLDRARFVTSDATCSDTCDGGCVGGSCADDGVACVGATPVDDYICEASACTQKVCEPLESYCVTESLKGICNESGTGYAGEVTDLDDCQSPDLAGEYAANWACIDETSTCACVPTCEEGICGGLDGCGGYCGCNPELYCKVDSEFDIGMPGAMANVTGACTDLSGLCDVDGETYCEGDTVYACMEVPALPPGSPPPGMVDAAEMLVAQILIDCPGAFGDHHVCAEDSEGFAECVCVPNCDGKSCDEDNGCGQPCVDLCEAGTACFPVLAEPADYQCIPVEEACDIQLPKCGTATTADEQKFDCPSDVCGDGLVCDAENCKPQVCEPLANFCGEEGAVHSCDAQGLTSSVTDPCDGTGEVCTDDVTGTFPIDGKCSCSEGFSPEDGGCTCIPSENTDNTCGPDGCGGKLTCAEGDYCDEADDSCKKQVCIPDAVQCGIDLVEANLNHIYTCLPDGSGVSDIFTDCAFTGEICKQLTPTEAACVEAVCSPNQPYCATETGVVICDEYGHGPTGNAPTLCEGGQTCLNGECITDCDAHECGLCGGEFLGECGPGESLAECSAYWDWDTYPADMWCDDGQCESAEYSSSPGCFFQQNQYASEGCEACMNLCYTIRKYDCGYHQPTQEELDLYGGLNPYNNVTGLNPLTTGDTCTCTNTTTYTAECADGFTCEEGTCTALPCGHADNSGPPGAPCDDGDPTTLGDICLDDVCKGFTRTDTGASDDRFVRVDYAHERWFAIYDALGLQWLGEVDIATGTYDVESDTHSVHFIGLQEGFALTSGGTLWAYNPTAEDWENVSEHFEFAVEVALGEALLTPTSMDIYTSMWVSPESEGGEVTQGWFAGMTDQGQPAVIGCADLDLMATGSPPTCTAYVNFNSNDGLVLDSSEIGSLAALTGGLHCNLTGACATELVLGSTVVGSPHVIPFFQFSSADGSDVWTNAGSEPSYYWNNNSQSVIAAAHCGEGKYLAVGHSGFARGRTGLGVWGTVIPGKSYLVGDNLFVEASVFFEAIWPEPDADRAFIAGNYHSNGIFQSYIWTASTATEDDLTTNLGPNVWQSTGLFSGATDVIFSELFDIWGTSEGTLVAVGHDTYDPATNGQTGGAPTAVIYVRDCSEQACLDAGL